MSHEVDQKRRNIVAGVAMGAAASILSSHSTRALAEDVPTTLVTGSNRGLGLEFARQYAKAGWRVIATCRKPDTATELEALAELHPQITIERLDVTDHDRIDALAEQYRDTPIDLLLNNAGIGGGAENQLFGKLKYDAYDQVLAVNTYGPIKMAEAFVDQVRASKLKKIISVSSSEGSIQLVRAPRLYWYRSSKSALNMLMKNLSKQLVRQGVTVGLVNPGPTATDFMKGVPMKLRDPVVATADMIRNIENMTIETTGSFIQYDGKPLPW